VEIYGTEGYIGYSGRPGDQIQLISTQLQPGEVQGAILPSKLPDPLPLPMDQWISAILHGAPLTVTVEDGRNLTELLEAVYNAAHSGREVRLAS
jgi:predicted dehydrogenase